MAEVMKCKLPFRKLQLPEITKWLEEKDSEGWNLKKLRGNTATFERSKTRHSYFFVKRKDYQNNKEVMKSKYSMLAGWNCYLELVSVEVGMAKEFENLQVDSLSSRIKTEETLMQIPWILVLIWLTYELSKAYRFSGNEPVFSGVTSYWAECLDIIFIVSIYMSVLLQMLQGMPYFTGRFYRVTNAARFVSIGIALLFLAILYVQ